jgi:hypothetical protein
MNLFCRLFGHTWLHKVDEPKIRWTTAKNMSELEATVDGAPRFYLECARCKDRRGWDDPEALERVRQQAS